MEKFKQQLQKLFKSSDLSAEDRTWLLDYLDKNDSSVLQQMMQQQFTENVSSDEKLQGDSAKKLLERIREKINDTEKPAKVISMNFWKRAVAVAIIILGASTFFLLINKEKKEIAQTNHVSPYKDDVAPGGNKAVLTLADGSTIILDSMQNGTLSQQGNTKVLKLDNGELAYAASGNSTEILYNTVSTPKGGQYNLTLADGSKVWLNAASSLRFPASFSGSERTVELTGEAYFEIAKNTAKPFKVNIAGKGELEVLGTHFNINSYTNEATVNTTLLEGSVKVSGLTTNDSRLITPGQQAQLAANGHINIKKQVDIEEVMAWKNGKFDFQAADIQSVMRQIERWYDVEVSFSGNITNEQFVGLISRDVKISRILKMLEESGAVKFEINGKKVIVK